MKKILIIEDNDILRENTSEFLRQEGFEVHSAENGEVGIKKAIDIIPDLIICDIAMPKKDGYEVYHELQFNESTSLTPFIFLTAKTEKHEVRAGMQMGVDDYITKPFEYEELLTSITIRLTKFEQIKAKNLEKAEEDKKVIEQQSQFLSEALDQLNNKAQKVTSSIEYARSIQKAMLPTFDKVKNVFPDSSVLYLPKDIVSGDFYWLQEKGDYIYFAGVDCTGHGVPGALMTVVSFNLLDQAVNEKKLQKPSDILCYINSSVNEKLNQNTDKSSVNEGMDMALCKMNKNTLHLEYAGANSPLLVFRDDKMIELAPDPYPIGIYSIMQDRSFTNKDIKLLKGDRLYLYSDGFQDQKGGERNKKYMSKNLKSAINNIKNLPMDIQMEKLFAEFQKWKANNEQIDDILIWGINIS